MRDGFQTDLPRAPGARAGFSLIELLIAAVVFTVVVGAALSLFATHQPLYSQQQNLSQLNISLRSAIAQMQLDVANAGANFFTGVNIPNYPVGVVITNNVVASGGDCRSGSPLVFSTNCFDQMSIIKADVNTPPANPMNSSSGCINTSSASLAPAYLSPSGSTTGYGTGTSVPAAATSAAAHYLSGDQILFVKVDGSQYTTAALTANGTTAKVGSYWYVVLNYGLTSSTGLNTSAGNDPYNMTTNANSMLGAVYCSTDWALRILPITYSVSLANPSNPVLTRVVAGTSQTVSQTTLASQIIGFKIGAALFNTATDADSTTYSFNAATYNNGSAVPYNYTLIRSVMVSLIGRTVPQTSGTYVYQNPFDSGFYQIQGISAVINPRNMSMND